MTPGFPNDQHNVMYGIVIEQNRNTQSILQDLNDRIAALENPNENENTRIANASINDLSDVNTTNASTGDVLSWNGNSWIPTVISSSGSGGGTIYTQGTGITISSSNVISIDQIASLNLTNLSSTTRGATDDSTNVATTAFVKTAISNLINSAPLALDTLNELAVALGNDANFSTTITNNLAAKLNTSDFTTTANSWFSAKRIDDLSDVSIGTLGTNHVLYYNGSTWVNTALDTSNVSEDSSFLYYTDDRVDTRIANASINDLSDVNTTNASTGDVLSWNGNSWIPTTGSVYCHVDGGDYGNKQAAGAVNATSNYVLVPFSYIIVESTSGIYNSTTGRFTPGVAGVYKVTARVQVSYTSNKGSILEAVLHKNNTATNPLATATTRIASGDSTKNESYSSSNGYIMRTSVHTIVSLTSTDYLQLFFFSNNSHGDTPSVWKRTKFLIHKIG